MCASPHASVILCLSSRPVVKFAMLNVSNLLMTRETSVSSTMSDHNWRLPLHATGSITHLDGKENKQLKPPELKPSRKAAEAKLK